MSLIVAKTPTKFKKQSKGNCQSISQLSSRMRFACGLVGKVYAWGVHATEVIKPLTNWKLEGLLLPIVIKTLLYLAYPYRCA